MRRSTTVLLIVAGALSYAFDTSAHHPLRHTEWTQADLASAADATARLVRDAGLTLTSADLPQQIVRAVLVDVDADGDDDLVANMGSLELGVWINDGSGRLTRAPAAARPPDWAPLPLMPAVDAQVARLDVTMPEASASVAAPPVRAGPAPPRLAHIGVPPDADVASTESSPSSPRAPPLA